MYLIIIIGCQSIIGFFLNPWRHSIAWGFAQYRINNNRCETKIPIHIFSISVSKTWPGRREGREHKKTKPHLQMRELKPREDK